DNLEAGLKQNQLETQQYANALKAADYDFSKAEAQFRVIAAEHKDNAMLAAIEAGNWDRSYQLLEQKTNLGFNIAQLKETDDMKRGLLALKQGQNVSPQSIDKETVDFYARQSLSGDNSWQVGLARGKVGQALISAVKDRIPQMAKELGMSPQDVGSNKATVSAL